MGKDGVMMLPLKLENGENKLGSKHDDRERENWSFECDWNFELLLKIVESALLPSNNSRCFSSLYFGLHYGLCRFLFRSDGTDVSFLPWAPLSSMQVLLLTMWWYSR